MTILTLLGLFSQFMMQLPHKLKQTSSYSSFPWDCLAHSAVLENRGPLNSFPASDDFCHLLITFANNLDPDQARQNVGPDLDPNCLTL